MGEGENPDPPWTLEYDDGDNLAMWFSEVEVGGIYHKEWGGHGGHGAPRVCTRTM